MSGQADKQGEQLRQIKKELYARRFKNAVDITVLRQKVDKLLAEVEKQKEEANNNNARYTDLKTSYESLLIENNETKADMAQVIAEACVKDLVEGMEVKVKANEINNRLIASGDRELQEAQAMIKDLESRVMAKNESIAALETEVATVRSSLAAVQQNEGKECEPPEVSLYH